MTVPSNTFSSSHTSSTTDKLANEIMLSLIITRLFNLETSVQLAPDSLSLFNSLLESTDHPFMRQFVNRAAMTVLLQRYLGKLIEKESTEEERDEYLFPETDQLNLLLN